MIPESIIMNNKKGASHLRRSQHGDHILFLLAQMYLFLIYDNLFQWYKSNVYFGHLKSNSRQTGSFVL